MNVSEAAAPSSRRHQKHQTSWQSKRTHAQKQKMFSGSNFGDVMFVNNSDSIETRRDIRRKHKVV